MTLPPLALLAAIAPGWLYLVAAAAACRRFAGRGIAAPLEPPAISVLKPLYGAEPGLYDNLQSFAEQAYPRFQIVLGLRDGGDPALPVARAFAGEHAGHDIAVVVDPRVRGSNLKVSNLEGMLPAARYDIVALSDSDIRVGRDYLAAIAAPFADRRTGIVTCLYEGVSTGGAWSELGALQVNFGFLPSALLADALGIGRGCFGATIALKREVLARAGGFARVRDELADDYRLGEAVRGLGLQVVLSRYIVQTRVFEPSLRSLWRHELRWSRTTRTLAPLGFAGSLFTHPVAIAAAAAAATGFTLTSCAFLGISCLLRWVTARVIAQALGLSRRRLWLLPARDILSFTLFIASFCGRSVFWKDQHYQVDPEGQMTADGEKAS